jgi:glucan phosphorylase
MLLSFGFNQTGVAADKVGAWARKAILNVADCGKFSSDHKIAQSHAGI